MVIAANLNTAVNSPFPDENACLKTCLTFICKQWYYSALTLLWSWIQWDWKAADCPFQAQKSALWSQCFCQNSPTFMLHLQTKVLHSSLASWHLSWPISQENFILFRMVAKKNLHFSFISVFFFCSFCCHWWHAELRILLPALPSSLWLSLCHPSPPSCAPSSLCYLVYELDEYNCSV